MCYKTPLFLIILAIEFKRDLREMTRYLERLVKKHSRRSIKRMKMRLSYVSTPNLRKRNSTSLRRPPSVPRLAVCDWRDLTYDSSIQILEMEEHSLIGQRICTRSARDSNQTMSSISEYGSEVMYASTTDHLRREYLRSGPVTSSSKDVRMTDLLGNTWNTLKEARLVSYLKEINNVNGYTYTNPSTAADNRKLCNKQEHVTTVGDKHLQRKYYSESVLMASRPTGNQTERSQTGSDVCFRSMHRKENDTLSRRITVPRVHEETTLVNPLQEIRHESKVGPVKTVKLRTLQREGRQRRQRRNGLLRPGVNGKGQPMKTPRRTRVLSNKALSTFIDATLKSLTNDRGSLSDFLLENETIPAINSATPIGDSRTHQYVKHLEPTFTRTPSLRTIRPRSVATSDLRDIQCRRSLNFNDSFLNDSGNEKEISPPHQNENETLIYHCSRKPQLGVSIKINEKPTVKEKDERTGNRMGISKPNRRMSIKTNGTINMLPKTTNTNTFTTRNTRRTGLSPVWSKRSNSIGSSKCHVSAVLESAV